VSSAGRLHAVERVKISDLKENSNLERITEPKENDYKLLEERPAAFVELALRPVPVDPFKGKREKS